MIWTILGIIFLFFVPVLALFHAIMFYCNRDVIKTSICMLLCTLSFIIGIIIFVNDAKNTSIIYDYCPICGQEITEE